MKMLKIQILKSKSADYILNFSFKSCYLINVESFQVNYRYEKKKLNDWSGKGGLGLVGQI